MRGKDREAVSDSMRLQFLAVHGTRGRLRLYVQTARHSERKAERVRAGSGSCCLVLRQRLVEIAEKKLRKELVRSCHGLAVYRPSVAWIADLRIEKIQCLLSISAAGSKVAEEERNRCAHVVAGDCDHRVHPALAALDHLLCVLPRPRQ